MERIIKIEGVHLSIWIAIEDTVSKLTQPAYPFDFGTVLLESRRLPVPSFIDFSSQLATPFLPLPKDPV